MIIHKNRTLWVGVLLLALIALAAFPACKAAPTPKEPIKVGATLPLNSATGEAQLAGLEIAFDEINAAGGISGRQIQFIYYNDEGNTEKVTSNTERLITADKCVALCGFSYSAHAIAGAKVLTKHGIPGISNSAASDELDNEPWMFRVVGGATEISAVQLAHAQRMGFKKVALLWINSAWGVSTRDVVTRDAAKYGLTLLGMEAVDSGASDVTVQLNKLKALGPECLIVVVYEKEIIATLMGLKAIGWNIPVLDNSGQLPGMLESVDTRLVEGVYTYQHTDVRKPLTQHIFDAYEKKTGKRWEFGQMVTGYDAAQIIAEALRLADNPDDSTSIRDAIRKVKIPMAVGKAGVVCDYSTKNWGPTAKQTQVYIIKDGKNVPVD